ADGFQGNLAGGIPDLRLLVDARRGFPAGPPVAVLAAAVQVNGQVDPVGGGSNLELAIVPDVLPIVSQEHLHHVAVPEPPPRLPVLRWLKEVERAIWANEQQIQIGVGPESPDLRLEIRVIQGAGAILDHPRRFRVLPGGRLRIGVELRRRLRVSDGETRRRARNLACRLRWCLRLGKQGRQRQPRQGNNQRRLERHGPYQRNFRLIWPMRPNDLVPVTRPKLELVKLPLGLPNWACSKALKNSARNCTDMSSRRRVTFCSPRSKFSIPGPWKK